jgi:hypothetical protein
MPPEQVGPSLNDLFQTVMDALIPRRSSPGGPNNIPPTWLQVWSRVRTVLGPVRSTLFIAGIVASVPLLLVWNSFWILSAKLILKVAPGTSANQLVAIITALLLTVLFGTGALLLWGWRGLLVVCLFVWLFTLFQRGLKPTSPQE